MRLDIERLKKLNSLAGELKHQGIAQNHEDAAFLAVTMVGEEGEQCLSDMHINDDQSLVIREIIKDKPASKAEGLKPAVSISPAQQSLAEEHAGSAAPVSGMSKEEVENVLQNFANALAHEFTVLQETVQQQHAQLAQLVEQIRALQLRQTQPQQVDQEQVPVQRTLQQPTQSQSTFSQTTANPRTGTFAADDVSIEKMFYFGSKKS